MKGDLGRSLGWLRSATGIVFVVGVTLVAAAAFVPSLRVLAIPGAVGVSAVVAKNAAIGTRRDADLRDRIAAVSEAARDRETRRHMELDARVRSLHDSFDAGLTCEQEARQAEMAEIVDRVGEITQRVEANRSEIVDRVGEITQRVADDYGRLRDVVDVKVAQERALRSFSIARMTDPRVAVHRVLLLMTIPRSGSTWLFDVLRTNPATRLAPSMEVWGALGLKGRRYPAAFADLDGAWRAIEVEYGRGATIEELAAADLPHPPLEDRWVLEKAHPQFTDFDAAGFARRVEAFRADGTELEIVYGIRDPLAAMWSMVRFKQRQPSWYASVAPADVPDWIARSLAVMVEMQAMLPGTVVDYRYGPDGAPIRSLARRINPDWDDTDISDWLGFAVSVVSRDRPQRPEAGFIGEPADGYDRAGPDGAWTGRMPVIDAAYAAYEELHAR